MTPDFDIAIIGSGFGGSLLAMIARRLGRTVLLLERDKHPRFAIGESTSPLMNLLIEEMAVRYDLPRLLPLCSYGAWLPSYPEIQRGKKRGFTYYHQVAGEAFPKDPNHDRQLLVAASPHDALADTHWLRADTDAFLMQEAVALGAEYHDETLLSEAEATAFGFHLRGTRRGAPFHASAKFVVDATGPNGFLSRVLQVPRAEFKGYPNTQALFSHFTEVRRTDAMNEFASAEAPPYAPDDAALHHVFDGGWMWVLRFDNGVTSAGFAVEDWLANEVGLCEGEAGWKRMLQRFPTVGAQFADAKPTLPLVYAPRLAYRSQRASGERWAALPSVVAFIDPLFSTGMPLTLLGIERLAALLENHAPDSIPPEALAQYERATFQEIDFTAQFIGACYASFAQFPLFVAYSMFYFAAASFSEMARRLDSPYRLKRFLAADRADFSEAALRLGAHLQSQKPLDPSAFLAEITQAISHLNVAGIADPNKRNWYPAELEDVIREAEKLGFSPSEMRQILQTAPWAQIPAS